MNEETAVVVQEQHTYSIATVEKQIEFASILKKFITEQKLVANIQGKQYVNVEGWQFSGMTLGIIPIVSKPVRIQGENGEIKYECECTLTKQATGEKVGYGYALCSNAEQAKKKFDEYAIASMAQTRSVGKAYRNLLAFVIKMAGFEPTPLEEMEGIENVPSSNGHEEKQEPKTFDPAASTVGFGKHMGKKWIELEESYLKFLLGSDSASIKADAQATLDYLGKKQPVQTTITDQYTQSEPEKPRLSYKDAVITFGTHKGTKFVDLPLDYLQWLAKDGKQPQAKKFAQEVLDHMDKKDEPIFSDDIPFEEVDSKPNGVVSDMVKHNLKQCQTWNAFTQYVKAQTHLLNNEEFKTLVNEEKKRFPESQKVKP